MQRRDLLKLPPLALVSTVGHMALAQSPTNAAADVLFNVRTYGATGDGNSIDTPAINRAIEAVAEAGGGPLLFPAGTYVCFTIRLKSKVDLYLSRGCTILAADSPKPGESSGYHGGTYDPAGPTQPWEAYQTTVTITGPTRSSTARTSVISPLPALDSSTAKASPGKRHKRRRLL